jgi:glutamate synthase (NADPH/NADH) small chain
MENRPIFPRLPKKMGKKIAIIGSGPAGITAAVDLVKYGYQVTLFEALHETGGVLSYGIPEFRLPKKIVHSEITSIEKLGVRIIPNMIIGRTLIIDELFDDGFEAIFIGIGAGTPNFLHVPGENLGGIYSANEFLTRINLMSAYRFPEADTPVNVGRSVTVIGGGNVAIDAARSAIRLGPEKVVLVYRRSKYEMPARPREIKHAEDEGVQFKFLTCPLRFIGDSKGQVQMMECIRVKPGKIDRLRKKIPVQISGSNFFIDNDSVIIAIGSRANPLIKTIAKDITLTQNGLILTDHITSRTSRERVWAGGDIVTGEATVISAMGAGKRASRDIHNYLTSNNTQWDDIKKPLRQKR